VRCLRGGSKTKGEPEKFGFRCPNCGHRVSVSKSRDGLTDRAIKAALEAVGAAGELTVLPEHIGYELVRRNATKAKKQKILLPISIGLFVLAFFCRLSFLGPIHRWPCLPRYMVFPEVEVA
jgi:DNA-directed RNA polymerase subunit RPC12/RpoP